MKVPLFDLTRQYKRLANDIEPIVKQVLGRGQFTLGREVDAFEKVFARFIQVPWAVSVGSGTDALTLGLKALGVGPGDEVIVPANVYPTAFGVALSGARLRLVDCRDDGTMNIDALSHVITKKTKAIVAVHLYGNPADVLRMHRCIRSNYQKIYIVEDAAQAHGARIYGERIAGSIGDIGCFSFYPSKNLGAYGDGGMVVTHDRHIAQRLRRLRMYGEESRYRSVEVSGVSRLDELQAAVLRVKLKHLPAWNRRRAAIADVYVKELTDVGDIRFVAPQIGRGVFHLFVLRSKKRDALQAFLAKKGIGTTVHYPVPVHLVRAFSSLGYKKGDFPVSETLSREVLSLPCFPELTDNEVGYVCGMIKQFFR